MIFFPSNRQKQASPGAAVRDRSSGTVLVHSLARHGRALQPPWAPASRALLLLPLLVPVLVPVEAVRSDQASPHSSVVASQRARRLQLAATAATERGGNSQTLLHLIGHVSVTLQLHHPLLLFSAPLSIFFFLLFRRAAGWRWGDCSMTSYVCCGWEEQTIPHIQSTQMASRRCICSLTRTQG